MAEKSTDEAARPSLERLKALDSLPGIFSQLEEAKQLCNHSARADMISKWLLERLISDPEFRRSLQAWEVLLSAFRLLSPERLATLLATHRFLQSCRTTLAAGSDINHLFPQVADVLNYLLDVSSGEKGVQLQAILSVSASQAATFFGAWLEALDSFEAGTHIFEECLLRRLLRPGEEIWGLRKRSADENELFSNNCLVPSARLVPFLYSETEPKQSLKRKRTDEGSGQKSCREVINTLLARHVLVPARTAFFRVHETGDAKTQRPVGTQDPAFNLRSMLEPLRRVDDNETTQGIQLPALSVLLEIGLRSTPIVTPKQRVRERPWIEAVFDALHECNTDGKIGTLSNMLSVLKDHDASLSESNLAKLIDQNFNLDSGNMAYELLSKFIDLDASVFTANDRAEKLFSAVSAIDVKKLSKSRTEIDTKTKEGKLLKRTFADFLRGSIIVPVMKSFIAERRLPAFMTMWAKQLEERNPGKQAFWAPLDSELAPLLEDSLPQDQIVGLFDRYFTDVQSAARSKDLDSESGLQSPLCAAIIVLNCILEGVRGEPLADALHIKAGELLDLMDQLCSRQSPTFDSLIFDVTRQPRAWALMASSFELWFPLWALQQQEPYTISEKGEALVTSNAFRLALEISFAEVRKEARRYVATLCHHLHKHGFSPLDGLSPQVTCLESLDMLGRAGKDADTHALLDFDDLVGLLQDDALNDLIIHIIDISSKILQVVATTVFRQSPTNDVDRLVEIFVECLGHKWGEEDEAMEDEEDASLDAKRESAVLDALLDISPESISRPHREQIINAVSARQQKAGGYDDNQFQRLALIVHLTTLNNATCSLMTDHSELWALETSIATASYADEIVAMSMLKQLTKQMVTHLLGTQQQERSRSMLINLGCSIKSRIEFICNRNQLDGSGKGLLIIGCIMCHLEGAVKDNLEYELQYRDAGLLRKFFETCFNYVTATLSEFDKDVAEIGALQPALELLGAAPDSLLKFSSVDTDAWFTAFNESTRTCQALEHSRGEGADRHYGNETVFFLCFRLVCKFAGPDFQDVLTLAVSVCKMRLLPETRQIFLDAFAQYVNRLPEDRFTQLVYCLVNETVYRDAALPLLEECVSRSQRLVVTPHPMVSPLTILRGLLPIAENAGNALDQKRLIGCVVAILKGCSSSMNQHAIETVLTTIPKFLEDPSTAPTLYIETTRLLSTLFLQYRARLHGRFHLVVQVFQTLISRLFQPTNSKPSVSGLGRKSTIKHAQAAAKLLTLFCEPPQFKRSSKSSDLVDEVRKEQAEVGKCVQYILHHYCSQVLTGTMEAGMREALMPGLWSMIDAMEMGEAEGVKSLSAAMNNSERAVLRGVYDEWRRFGKWKGA